MQIVDLCGYGLIVGINRAANRYPLFCSRLPVVDGQILLRPVCPVRLSNRQIKITCRIVQHQGSIIAQGKTRFFRLTSVTEGKLEAAQQWRIRKRINSFTCFHIRRLVICHRYNGDIQRKLVNQTALGKNKICFRVSVVHNLLVIACIRIQIVVIQRDIIQNDYPVAFKCHVCFITLKALRCEFESIGAGWYIPQLIIPVIIRWRIRL